MQPLFAKSLNQTKSNSIHSTQTPMSTTVSRLITSFQSTGRMRRSTLQQALISWFAFAGVEFSAIDCDSEHKTLSGWYPDIATFFPYLLDDDHLPSLNLAGSPPVE